MKRDSARRQLDQLTAIRHAPTAPGAAAILADCLQSKSNFVVARAAEIVERAQLLEFAPALLDAYNRFLPDAPKLDKGCEAVTASIHALYALDQHDAEAYLRGSRHRQVEGYGGSDTAEGLRCACALGLSQTRHPEAIDRLAYLLTDPGSRVRASAARAVGCLPNADTSMPLLKLKLYTGDEELDVLAECMIAMLHVSIPRAIGVISGQLDSGDDDRSHAAALALGSVRDERAFALLRAKWERSAAAETKRRMLDAISTSRTDQALGFLYDLVENGPGPTCQAATRALLLHRNDAGIVSKIQTLGAQRAEVATVLAELGLSF